MRLRLHHLCPRLHFCARLLLPVDGDPVPVPHYGVALSLDQFHALAQRCRQHGIEFKIEPHLRFPGGPGRSSTRCWQLHCGGVRALRCVLGGADCCL